MKIESRFVVGSDSGGEGSGRGGVKGHKVSFSG